MFLTDEREHANDLDTNSRDVDNTKDTAHQEAYDNNALYYEIGTSTSGSLPVTCGPIEPLLAGARFDIKTHK
ncbi:hypothetical protein STEG23_031746 [Scotinomys teguina]